MQNGGVQTAIKGIQRGVTDLNAVTTITATVAAVNVQKSVVRVLGSQMLGGATAPSDFCGYVVLTNSTTVSFFRNGVTGNLRISWELVEYN